jgi:hypothetical protein
VAKSDFERKADQLRSQIEDVRSNLDDLLKNYNRFLASGSEWLAQAQKPVAQAARQARENVESAGEGLTEAGIPWWIPLAVVGVIGIGVWLYNTFMSGTPGAPAASPPQSFTNYQAGTQPPFTSPETSFTEQR